MLEPVSNIAFGHQHCARRGFHTAHEKTKLEEMRRTFQCLRDRAGQGDVQACRIGRATGIPKYFPGRLFRQDLLPPSKRDQCRTPTITRTTATVSKSVTIITPAAIP